MDGGQVCKCMKQTSTCGMHPSTPEEWTSYMRVSLAKIFQSPVLETALKEAQEAVCGGTSHIPLAVYDHNLHSWKTPQQSLLGGLTSFSETWPRWGTMQNGVCYQLPQSVRPTTVLDGGALPTWQKASKSGSHISNHSIAPTLTSRDWKSTSPAKNSTNSRPLSEWIGGLLPTLTVHGNHNRKGVSSTSGDGLVTTLKMLPTMTARLGDQRGPQAKRFTDPKRSKDLDDAIAYLNPDVGGQLNPRWGEWYMGWPIDATE